MRTLPLDSTAIVTHFITIYGDFQHPEQAGWTCLEQSAYISVGMVKGIDSLVEWCVFIWGLLHIFAQRAGSDRWYFFKWFTFSRGYGVCSSNALDLIGGISSDGLLSFVYVCRDALYLLVPSV